MANSVLHRLEIAQSESTYLGRQLAASEARKVFVEEKLTEACECLCTALYLIDKARASQPDKWQREADALVKRLAASFKHPEAVLHGSVASAPLLDKTPYPE